MKIYLVALSLFFLGCGKNSASDADVTSQATYQAVCQVFDMNGNPVACIDYPADVAGQNTACMNTEAGHFSAVGATGAAYVAVTTAGASTSCALTFPSAHSSMSCNVNGTAFVRYYFSQASIQTDCTNRGGTLVPNVK